MMTNTRNRKTQRAYKDFQHQHKDGREVENIATSHFSPLLNNTSANTDVDGEFTTSGETSTSFSLQECMDEFRSRRIRRLSTHSREKKDKIHDHSEIDPINQNLCNKAHEKKCKPCKDGFCYCFASDSGDGSACNKGFSMRNPKMMRHSRYWAENEKSKRQTNKLSNNNVKEPSLLRCDTKTKSQSLKCGQITAISRLEASHENDPLIHIIQELRDNCVISEVKVNKRLLQKNSKKNITLENNGNESQKIKLQRNKTFHSLPMEPHLPSAPLLKDLSEEETQDSNNYKHSMRHKSGGRLLQKRLRSKNISYTACVSKNPPPKPPRSSLSYGEKSTGSSSSTSSSIREAERILDEFLARHGGSNNKPVENHNIPSNASGTQNQCTSTTPGYRIEREKRMSYPLGQKVKVSKAKQVLAKYPSLSDIHRIIDTKEVPQYERNICKIGSEQKVTRVGWIDPKIRDMLNCESNMTQKTFNSNISQAEPQQTKQNVGWHVSTKQELDTVDGIGRHNIASNVGNKDTPIKAEVVESTKRKKSTSKQKSVWSEHLRNLSPWSQKRRETTIRSSSKEFLKSSKEKILRIVSPKKDNKERLNMQIRKTPYRNVGIQTSQDEFFQQSYTQTPPGSYHSPLQSSLPQSISFVESQNISSNGVDSVNTEFDFTRHIKSPPKKPCRTSQRKLHFPLKCSVSSTENNERNGVAGPDIKTYRSFNEELNQDVTLSKMSYILSNIRAKLEASDHQAIRTFQETGHPTHISNVSKYDIEPVQMKNNHEPIYSEIEDDTIHISESPNLESHTGTSVQHFTVEHSPDVLYALVNKPAKLNKIGGTSFPATKAPEIPLPLGKILHDSLKSRRLTSRKPSLSPLAEPSCGDSESYEFPSPKGCKLMQSQSMNNVRVMEHNSSPKRQNNLCKSDLSLYRSELFFENLCKTELVPAHFDNKDDKKLQKIDNRDPMPSLTSPSPIFKVNTIKDDQKCQLKQDVVSYELPAESIYGEIDSLNDSINGFNIIAHPSIDNQSTPKKPSFTTKENEGQLNVDINHEDVSKNESRLGSCYSNSSMAEDNSRSDSDYKMKSKQSKSLNILPNYKHLKKVLYRSFRRSKDLVKTRAEHFSSAFIRYNSEGCMNMRKNEVVRSCSPIESEIDLDSLFALSQSTSAAEQLTKVVNICRKLPGSEISSEMVEAERLLLFSQLRCGHHQSGLPQLFGGTPEHQQENCIFIDEMFLPIRDEFNRAIFFNYFYIVTFECKGIIRSTQSAECQNGLAVFRDCGIEFTCHSQGIEDEPPVIQCNIFMLRLRKVSGITSEPSTAKNLRSGRLSPSISTSSSSSNEIVSRFRLQASFTLTWRNFIPYSYIAHKSINSESIYLQTRRTIKVLLNQTTLSSNNLEGELKLTGRAEIRLPKTQYSGFLNVEDPFSQHNWNRRWCLLDGVNLQVWRDENVLSKSPLFTLDLQLNAQNFVSPANADLCARPRSFCLQGAINKAEEDALPIAVFFAADTQTDLELWLEYLNQIFRFINNWLQ